MSFLVAVFRFAFKHLRVVAGIQLGTTVHRDYQKEVIIKHEIYETDPILSVTGKAATGAMAAAARTKAMESLI